MIDATIAANIKARYAAEVIADLIDEEAKVHGKRLWEQIMSIASAHVPPPRLRKEKTGPMTDGEAKLFGKQTIPFGEFAGTPVDSVPLDRLRWYADQRFVDELRRYLRSARIESEDGEDQE